NLTAFTGVDSQNLPDVMVSVQFILAIGEYKYVKKERKISLLKERKSSLPRERNSRKLFRKNRAKPLLFKA
ncbi:hypothetical protein, partial [Lactobacillus delbrueckii]